MATVYRAYDSRLDVERAIKMLEERLTKSKRVRERFVNEARTMAKLQHRNIVAVADVAVEGERVYMVMEVVRGGDLAERVESAGPLPPRMAADVCADVLAGLNVAHARGVVHRDIKPHNVLLAADGTPKLSDFGIARLDTTDRSTTKTGAILGTWAYMAPEQRQGSKTVDARSDIYSVGSMLYALVTGKEPFDLYSRELHVETFEGIDPVVGEVIKKATCYNMDERYQSSQEMREALLEAMPQMPETPPGTPGIVDPGSFTDEFTALDAVPASSLGDRSTNPEETFAFESGIAKVPDEVLAALGSMSDTDIGRVVQRGTGEHAGLPATATATSEIAGPPASPLRIVLGLALAALVLGGVSFGSAGMAVFLSSPAAETTVVTVPMAPPTPVATGKPSPEPSPELLTPPAEPAPPRVHDKRPKPTPPIRPPKKPLTPATQPKDAVSMLYVSSLPVSVVQVDGRPVGKTPWKGQVSPGKHDVVVQIEGEGRPIKRTLKVLDGIPKRFCWDFNMEAQCQR